MTGEATFQALPGPARVTYGEAVAYRATFTNTGKSTFTHVIFRMGVPTVPASVSQPATAATLVASTCPSAPVVVSRASGPEWTCDFGKLKPGKPGTPQLVLTIVWKAPSLGLPNGCDDCLQSNGRWKIKEGVNDTADPNDTFPFGGSNAPATLLSSSSPSEAGSYETDFDPCTDALGAGSLGTSQALSKSSNPNSTTICLPSPIPTNSVDLGLASTILEGPSQPGDQGHAAFGRSTVCIAALGEVCADGYTPANFAPRVTTTVLRGSADALPRYTTITAVYHDNHLLPWCPSTDPNGCVVSITYDKWKRTWTAVIQSATNGFYNW